jgi:hypothetical protein
MNLKDLEGSSRGVILRYRPGIRLEGLRKITENSSQDSRSRGWHMNTAYTHSLTLDTTFGQLHQTCTTKSISLAYVFIISYIFSLFSSGRLPRYFVRKFRVRILLRLFLAWIFNFLDSTTEFVLHSLNKITKYLIIYSKFFIDLSLLGLNFFPNVLYKNKSKRKRRCPETVYSNLYLQRQKIWRELINFLLNERQKLGRSRHIICSYRLIFGQTDIHTQFCVFSYRPNVSYLFSKCPRGTVVFPGLDRCVSLLKSNNDFFPICRKYKDNGYTFLNFTVFFFFLQSFLCSKPDFPSTSTKIQSIEKNGIYSLKCGPTFRCEISHII